jgi:3-ketosteroid 9alpha-monooxygenase subunit B
MSILKSALARGSGRIVLVYANRDPESVIFAAALRELGDKHPQRLVVMHWLETLQGLPGAAALAALAAPYTGHRTFLCGPKAFMDRVHDALAQLGVQRDRTHAEVFNSLSGDPFVAAAPAPETERDDPDAATVEVELDGRVHTLRWPRRRTLVDIMLAEGIDVPYSCQEGSCGSCACTVLAGKVKMDNCEILDPEDIDNGYILGCQAHPVTDHLKIQF